MRNSIITLVFLSVLVSCDSDIVFSESRSISGTWDKNEGIEFIIPSLDSLKRYDVYVNVRNSNDYPFSNLFLIVEMSFPHGKTITDTLEYKMALPDGTWLGEGVGSIKENKLWYKENVPFLERGDYRLRISQAVRNNGDVDGVTDLEGITDVGYSIEEASQRNE